MAEAEEADSSPDLATSGAPFSSYDEMYATTIAHGNAPWKCFSTSYSGAIGRGTPSWQLARYDVWYRDPDVVIANLLSNPEFDTQFDYTPYTETDSTGKRRWSDFMSANFAWRHGVRFLQSQTYYTSADINLRPISMILIRQLRVLCTVE